jgi:hypothetical protein
LIRESNNIMAIMGGRETGRGPLQLDIGIVVSGLGGNSDEERNQLNGLVSFSGIDFPHRHSCIRPWREL